MKSSGGIRQVLSSPNQGADENSNVGNILAGSVHENGKESKTTSMKPTFKEALLDIDELRGSRGSSGMHFQPLTRMRSSIGCYLELSNTCYVLAHFRYCLSTGSKSGKIAPSRQLSSRYKGNYRTMPQLKPLRSMPEQSNVDTLVPMKRNPEAVSTSRAPKLVAANGLSQSMTLNSASCAAALSGSILASMDDSINIDNVRTASEKQDALGDDQGSSEMHSSLNSINEENDASLFEAVDKILAIDLEDEMTGAEHRPRVVMDVGEPLRDMLYLTNIPKEMTYDRLQDLVEPFGEISTINWDSNLPGVAEVMYADLACAEEAMQYLSDSIVGGSEDQPPLKAELRSREAGTQLFVGDLTPDVTEAMLEEVFGSLVEGPVTAVLKRDPQSFSPIGYGFLSFENEFAASKALVDGHRMAVGNAKVRVGRAERNTFLYVSDLNFDVNMEELKQVFGQHGALVEEDTVIVRRSYAFIRFRDRESAESAKRNLDKTLLRSRMSVRYAEAESVKSTVQVQFHSSVPRPPSSLKDLLHATFSKYGNCSIDIPRLHNGTWRKTAFVQYHGDSIAATVAATDAVQNVKFVSNIPVLAQFARELIPRVSPKGVATGIGNHHHIASTGMPARSFRGENSPTRNFPGTGDRGASNAGSEMQYQDQRRLPFAGIPSSHGGDNGSIFRHDDAGADNQETCFDIVEGRDGSQSPSQAEPDTSRMGRKTAYHSKAKADKGSRSGSFDRSKRSHRRTSSSRRSSQGDGPENRGGEVAYVPVYMPMSSMGHPYAMSGMPGLMTESEFAAATSGYIAPQFHGGMPPLMYPGQMPSQVQPGTFGYGVAPPLGMMGLSGPPYHDAETSPDAFQG